MNICGVDAIESCVLPMEALLLQEKEEKNVKLTSYAKMKKHFNIYKNIGIR